MDLAAETVKEFQGMKDRYRKGTKIYEQAYKSLRVRWDPKLKFLGEGADLIWSGSGF